MASWKDGRSSAMKDDPIEMVRSVFGNWEAEFVARRRETIFKAVGAALTAGMFAFALATIWVYEKPRATLGQSAVRLSR